MQKLAGIIIENRYVDEAEENPTMTPEKVVNSTSKILNKIKNDPKIDAFAADIANDPKKKQALLDLSKKLGINPLYLDENVEDISKELALKFAKETQNKLNEETGRLEEDEDVTTKAVSAFAGLFSGAAAASLLVQKLGIFVYTYVDVWGETLTNPEGWVPFIGMAVGAIGGWILGAIIDKVFGK
jgi:hypothetical protein